MSGSHYRTKPPPASLTNRQKEVLYALASYRTLQEVGRVLSISRNTIRSHCTKISQHLNCDAKKTTIVAVAFQKGEITVEGLDRFRVRQGVRDGLQDDVAAETVEDL